MGDLKTLRDIQFGKDFPYLKRDIANVRDLKKEAIKWVKEWNKTIESDVVRCPIAPEYEAARIAVYNECLFAIKWAKHFFNITEEDLE